jgi:hypothetical protein
LVTGELEIPNGVRKYVPAPPENGDDVFGLKHMRRGMVNHFEEGLKEGIVLVFYPHHIRAFVDCQSIAAGEVNEIGVLARRLSINYQMQAFIHQIQRTVEKIESELGLVLRDGDDQKQLSELISKFITGSGVLVDGLEKSEVENKEEFQRIVQRLNELKVLLVNALFGQEGWPIKKMFREESRRP